MHFRWAALIVAIAWAVAGRAHAAIVYSFDQPTYTLTPGKSVTVPVSLEFTGSDAPDLAGHGGLLSAAFRVVRIGTPPADPVIPTLIAGNTADFNDPILTPLLLGPSSTQAGIWEFADLTRSTGVLGQSLDANTRSIPLGQVTFTAGSSPGETMFQAETYDPTLQTTVTFDAPSITLDASILTSTVTFTVVPEPGPGLALVAAAPMVFFGRRLSRRPL